MSVNDFEFAVKFVREAPKMNSSNDQKLEFYKYFKQATEGDVKGSRPGAFSFVDRAKWDAWNSVKGLSQDDAKKKYVNLVQNPRPTWKEDAKRMGISPP